MKRNKSEKSPSQAEMLTEAEIEALRKDKKEKNKRMKDLFKEINK